MYRRVCRSSLVVIGAFFCLFGLTGCWDVTEVNDIAIVIATAMDNAPGNFVRVSLQISVPSGSVGGGGGGGSSSSGGGGGGGSSSSGGGGGGGSGSSGGGGGGGSSSSGGGGGSGSGSSGGGSGGGEAAGKSYFVVSAVGKDLRDADRNLQQMVSRRLFFAHRRIILIGEDLAKRGIRDILDEPGRNPQSRLRTNVVVTQGQALDFLKVSYPYERVPAEALRKIIFGSSPNYSRMDLKELSIQLASAAEDEMLPYVIWQKPVPGAPRQFSADGTAVFREGKMVGKLNSNQTRGLLWLRDEMRRGSVTCTVQGHPGPITVELLRQHTGYSIQMVKGHPQIKVTVRSESDVHENNSNLNLNDPQNVKLVERAYSDRIKQTMQNTLDVLQHRYDVDIVSFSERVHDASPQDWQRLESNWKTEFARLPVEVEVQGKIRRAGMTGQTLSSRDNEVSR